MLCRSEAGVRHQGWDSVTDGELGPQDAGFVCGAVLLEGEAPGLLLSAHGKTE